MKLSEIQKLDEKGDIEDQACASLKLSDELSPYTAYTVLKDLFGNPNEDFDVTKSEWAYALKVPGATIEIYDWKLGLVNIRIYAKSDNEAIRIGKEFIEFLKKQFNNCNKDKMKLAIEKTKSYVLQNPFALYYNSAENIMKELEQINSSELENSLLLLEKSLQLEDLYRSAFFLFIASFEGFLNLIYELYLKSELKDERIYDRLSREQIDIKLRLAPVYCNCFKSKLINSDSESFKKFHSIINLRNDFIHANLTKAMKIPIIIDDNRRLMHLEVKRDKLGLPKSIDKLEVKDLQLIKESIDEMVNILLQDMKPQYKKNFKDVMTKKFVLIKIEEDEVIILGGDDYIC